MDGKAPPGYLINVFYTLTDEYMWTCLKINKKYHLYFLCILFEGKIVVFVLMVLI